MRTRSTRGPSAAVLRIALAGALAVTTVGLFGCVVHPRPAAVVRLGPPVVIATGHLHTDRCGHFRYDGRWYHVSGHVHGPRCGHVRRGGVWVLVR